MLNILAKFVHNCVNNRPDRIKKDRTSLWEAANGKIGNMEENLQGSASMYEVTDNFDLRQFSMLRMSIFKNSKLA